MSFLFSGLFTKKTEDTHAVQAQPQQNPVNTSQTQQSESNKSLEEKSQAENIASQNQNRQSTFASQQQQFSSIPKQTPDQNVSTEMKHKPVIMSTLNANEGPSVYNPPNLFMGLSTKTQPSTSNLNTSGSLGNKSNDNLNTFDQFSLLNQNKPKPDQQQQMPSSINALFAGLDKKSTQPQVQSNPQDIFAQLNLAPKSTQQMSNPYQKQSLGEFQQQILVGPAFQPPSSLISGFPMQTSHKQHDDPFAGIDQHHHEYNKESSQNQSSGSVFGFLGQQQNQQKNEKQQSRITAKDNNDMSISSINNISKHSFEELEKNETSVPSQNYYLQKLPEINLPTESQSESNAFCFIQQNQERGNAPYAPPKTMNTSGGVGTFDIDKSEGKDIKDENFEEIMESKDIIEDRILRIKHQMIDFTMKQQDLSAKIQALEKDIELLHTKLEDLTYQQQSAIEREDYEEADQLNMRIVQTKNLIFAKESQIKRLDEDYMTFESRKGDKFKDLSKLIHKSLDKMSELRDKQQEEMQQFEESEMNAIEEKKKRLHYESIRIDQTKIEINGDREKVNVKLQSIEDKVYDQTRDEQLQKQEVESKIEKVGLEIEEIEKLLQQKLKQRETFLFEKQSLEKEIDKVRSKFRDQILKLELQLDKVQKNQDKTTREYEDYLRDQRDLDDYQESYKTRIDGYQKELREMDDFEKQLQKSVESIDSTMNEKESCRENAFMIKQEINQIKIKRENLHNNMEYITEKLGKIDAECEELQNTINHNEKKINKLEQEKKKAAAQKKFKEASKAQNEIKEHTTALEEASVKLVKVKQEKDLIEKEIKKKEQEMELFSTQLKEQQEGYEKVQLKIFSYRKEDILDLLSCLQNMGKLQGLKQSEINKKTESLNTELLKIDNELFELEKKYGEFNVRSCSTAKEDEQQEEFKNDSMLQNEEQVMAPENQVLVIEQSRLSVDDGTVKQEQQTVKEQSKSKEELENEIRDLETKVSELEQLVETSVGVEDYEQADIYQGRLDDIQQNQLPLLREQLAQAQIQEEQISEQTDNAYNPPAVEIEFESKESPIKNEENNKITLETAQEESLKDSKDSAEKLQEAEAIQQIIEEPIKQEKQEEQIIEQQESLEQEINKSSDSKHQEEQQEHQNEEQEEPLQDNQGEYNPPQLFS